MQGLDELLRQLTGLDGWAEADQDSALRALDESGNAVFATLVALVHAAYYSDPRSWPGLGYTTNIPGRP